MNKYNHELREVDSHIYYMKICIAKLVELVLNQSGNGLLKITIYWFGYVLC